MGRTALLDGDLLGGELEGSASIRGWDADWVCERLHDHVGSSFDVTVTGPVVVLALDDPPSVRAALLSLTRVRELRGDEPPGVPPPDDLVH